MYVNLTYKIAMSRQTLTMRNMGSRRGLMKWQYKKSHRITSGDWETMQRTVRCIIFFKYKYKTN